MREVYLRFVSGGGWDSKIIRYRTRSKWSHVENYDPLTAETYGAMLKGGVTHRSLLDEQYAKATDTKIVSLKLSDEEFLLYQRFLVEQFGKPYDWRAIAGFAMGERKFPFYPRNWREDDSWFCSELICRALEVAGVLKLPEDVPSCFITPRDVWAFTAGLKS